MYHSQVLIHPDTAFLIFNVFLNPSLIHYRLYSLSSYKTVVMFLLLFSLSINMLYNWELIYYVIRRTTRVIISLRLGLKLRLRSSWLIYYVIVFTNIFQNFLSLFSFFFPSVNVIVRLFILKSLKKSLIFHSDLQ